MCIRKWSRLHPARDIARSILYFTTKAKENLSRSARAVVQVLIRLTWDVELHSWIWTMTALSISSSRTTVTRRLCYITAAETEITFSISGLLERRAIVMDWEREFG